MKHSGVFWHPLAAEPWLERGASPRRLRRPRFRDGLAISFAIFFMAMAACVALEPEAARDNNGVSYFDHVSFALIPYMVGVLAIAATALFAALDLPGKRAPWPVLRMALFGIAALLVGIVLTPDYVNDWFNWAHVAISVALFGGQFALIAWLALKVWPERLNVALFVLLTVTGLIAGASQLDMLQFLFVSEIVYQLIFLIVLARVALHFEPDPTASATETEELRRAGRPRQGSNLRPSA